VRCGRNCTSNPYWVGRSGITHLALGAIDIALWDLKAKDAGMPLWKLLGGSASKKVEAYNTDGGWLNWPLDVMVSDCKRLVEEEGYRAVKLKVGGPNPKEDLRRVEAVRNAPGPDIRIMMDANGRWSLPQAIQTASRLADFDIAWIEGPIYFDDVEGHRRLAELPRLWPLGSSSTRPRTSAISFRPVPSIMCSRTWCVSRAAWASAGQLARRPRIRRGLTANALLWGAGPRIGRSGPPPVFSKWH